MPSGFLSRKASHLWPSYAGDGVGGNTDGADVPLTYLHGDHPGFRPMASSWAAYAKARLVSASVRTADRREPMTFSQREKVPMQLPRFARELHRRLRGATTRAIVGPAGTFHGIGPGFALSGLNTKTLTQPRASPWAISFGPFRARSSALNLTPLGTKPQWLALR